MNRNRISLFLGGLLILLGVAFLLESFGVIHFMGRFVWAVILGGVSLPFWLVFLSDRRQWWALIPACVLSGIGMGVLVQGQLAGIIITGSISLPFWLIYLNDRRNWWALIPGWVMLCVSAIVLLSWIGLEWFIAPFVNFAIAAPFLLVYIRDREQWWALIPGGIMLVISLLLLVAAIARSFAFWPVLLILVGIWLIFRAFRPQRASPMSSTPSSAEQVAQPDPAAQPEEPR